MIDFLEYRFPQIPGTKWIERMAAHKVKDIHGHFYQPDALFEPGVTLYYFREIDNEKQIPFDEKILFCDDHLMAVYKPHFLPVTPAGKFVNESLLNRLILKTGNNELTPVNRIDRLTAGLVLFSTNQKTRGLYQKLFMDRCVEKEYEAFAEIAKNADITKRTFTVENRLVPGTPWFRMQVEKGPVNSKTIIELLDTKDGIAHFRLLPITGKKHQLRIHLSMSGFNIINDPVYPELLPEKEDNYNNPLQLFAKRLSFIDPITGKTREFE
jgi:tRNA pseudouridine32 synthase/23S rRNA pseudouridine746 synthase